MISFLSVFPPFRGGIANFSDHLFRELDKTEDVRCYNFSKLYPSLLFPGTNQYDPVSQADYALPLLHSYNPLKWPGTGLRIGRDKPDTLLLSLWHPFFIPAYLQVISKVKSVSPNTRIACIAHNVEPHDSFPMGNSLIQRFLNKVDVLFTLSSQTTEEAGHFPFDGEVHQLFHPIYPLDNPSTSKKELRKKYGYSDDEKVLLFFGLIRPYKGLDVMIDALNSLDLESLNLKALIAGEFYEAKEPYEERIKDGFRDRYTFLDHFLTEEEMAEVFTLSDALILPYKTASQSGILANAINFEIPVISSRHPGLTDFIHDEVHGLIFENLNHHDAAQKIDRFMKNPSIGSGMREALTSLKEELSWGKFSAEIMKILNESS